MEPTFTTNKVLMFYKKMEELKKFLKEIERGSPNSDKIEITVSAYTDEYTCEYIDVDVNVFNEFYYKSSDGKSYHEVWHDTVQLMYDVENEKFEISDSYEYRLSMPSHHFKVLTLLKELLGE